MKRFVLLAAIGMMVLGACSENEGERAREGGEGGRSDCGPAPTAASESPTLPSGFPSPEEVTYTGSSQAGPSTIVNGYWDGDLAEAFDAYKEGFESAGYTVTKDEMEEDDGEVGFSGGDSTGQVKLEEECEGRTTITITVRPG